MADMFVFGTAGDQFRTYASASKDPNTAIGTEMVLDDGRRFRFALNGASAGAAGKLFQSPAPVANGVGLTTAAVAVGDTTISVTLGATAVTANQYRDGFIVFEDASGQGYTYRIAAHAAVTSGGTFVVPLVGKTQVAATSSAVTSLIRNPCAQVIIHPSPPTAPLAGVVMGAPAAAAYCWLQIKGVASVLQDGTLVAGKGCVASTSVDGAVAPPALTEGTPNTGFDQLFAGQVIRSAGDTKYGTVDLDIK